MLFSKTLKKKTWDEPDIVHLQGNWWSPQCQPDGPRLFNWCELNSLPWLDHSFGAKDAKGCNFGVRGSLDLKSRSWSGAKDSLFPSQQSTRDPGRVCHWLLAPLRLKQLSKGCREHQGALGECRKPKANSCPLPQVSGFLTNWLTMPLSAAISRWHPVYQVAKWNSMATTGKQCFIMVETNKSAVWHLLGRWQLHFQDIGPTWSCSFFFSSLRNNLGYPYFALTIHFSALLLNRSGHPPKRSFVWQRSGHHNLNSVPRSVHARAPWIFVLCLWPPGMGEHTHLPEQMRWRALRCCNCRYHISPCSPSDQSQVPGRAWNQLSLTCDDHGWSRRQGQNLPTSSSSLKTGACVIIPRWYWILEQCEILHCLASNFENVSF